MVNDCDPNDPCDYQRLSQIERAELQNWIGEVFQPATRVIRARGYRETSYGWKHCFEGSEKGFYITNGMFKGAMLEAGYEPVKRTDFNWRFRIKLNRKLTEYERNAV